MIITNEKMQLKTDGFEGVKRRPNLAKDERQKDACVEQASRALSE